MRAAAGFMLLLLTTSTASAQTFANYRCADGSVIAAEFFETPRSVSLQIDGKSIILPRKLFSVSGARYAKAGINLRFSRNEIGLKRKGHRYIACTAQ